MKTIIEESLLKSYSYSEYQNIISNLLAEGKSSGLIQNEEMLHYSKLNVQRMKRLDKTMVLSENVSNELKLISKKYTLLVLTEGWCGDAAQTLPVLNLMTEVNPNLNLKIVFRDENDALMSQFLTNGGKSIPKLIVLDADNNEVLADWGPRSQLATDHVISLKNKYGGITDEVKEGLQKWYNEDKGISAQNEIIEILKNAAV